MTTQVYQRRLAAVWFVGAAVIISLQVAQSVAGRFGDKTDEAWAWLLPNLMPISTLIVTVLVLESQGKGVKKQVVPGFVYRLAMGLCIGYLLLVLVSILAQPLSTTPILTSMQQSNLWLGPIQGLASAALGAFFIQPGSENTEVGSPTL
ncbi:MAG TPA: hypothetical protein VIP11_02275 [Gemmatimonadaceae bacterium]